MSTVDPALPHLLASDANRDADAYVRSLRAIGAVGWATRALVYFMVAGIVVKIALTGGAEPQRASRTGVLDTLLDKPLGTIMVAAVGIGALTYMAARLAPLFLDRVHSTATQWVRGVGTAVIYLSLAVGCWHEIVENRSGDWGGDEPAQELAGSLLTTWWGTLGLGALALGLIGYGGWQFWRAVSRRFLDRLDRDRSPLARGWVRAVGIAGFASRGLIAVTAGVFAGFAMFERDPGELHALDGSFRTVLRAPGGVPIVLGLAVGIACFGLYCAVAATARDHENG